MYQSKLKKEQKKNQFASSDFLPVDTNPESSKLQQNFQRFPHSLHSTKVVMGSSALRVCTCV